MTTYKKLDVEELLAVLPLSDKIKLLSGKGELMTATPLLLLHTAEAASSPLNPDFWAFESVPKHGIPPIRVSDGPNGVRGSRFFNGTPVSRSSFRGRKIKLTIRLQANCFPSSTGTGASFDVELVERIGKALGNECRAKGAHVLLGPVSRFYRAIGRSAIAEESLY